MRLTKKQKMLLDELGSDPGTLECLPSDKRSAEALQRKGLIRIVNPSHMGYFEIERVSREKEDAKA